MAETLTPIDGGKLEDENPPELNSAARAEIIRQTCHDLKSIDDKISGLQEDKRALKQEKIKAGLDMKLADFAAIYRLYNLDDDRRETFIDTLKEGFQALGIGAQLDWIEGVGATG